MQQTHKFHFIIESIIFIINLLTSEKTYRLSNYNLYDLDRTIIVSLCDKVTGVKAALNIGNSPTDSTIDTSINDTIVNFKDTVLEQSVRSIIYKATGDILKSDIKNIFELNVDEGCKDLSGIENFTTLNTINIYSDKISDLSPLKKVLNLGSIIYKANSISDIKSLEGLKNLSYLDIKKY